MALLRRSPLLILPDDADRLVSCYALLRVYYALVSSEITSYVVLLFALSGFPSRWSLGIGPWRRRWAEQSRTWRTSCAGASGSPGRMHAVPDAHDELSVTEQPSASTAVGGSVTHRAD